MRKVEIESISEVSAALDIALAYFAYGLNVLPCLPSSKEPAMVWKKWMATPQTEYDIINLFAPHKGNIAIICGPSSGNLVVVDCEDRVVFEECLAEIKTKFGHTWAVRTQRGGHIYLRPPWNAVPRKFDKFEIRSSSQYVLAPPSIHPSGKRYEFVDKPSQIIQIPSGDLGFITLQEKRSRVPNTRSSAEKIQNLIVVARRYQVQGQYASRSEFDQAVITAGINMEATIEEIRSILSREEFDTRYRALGMRGEDYLSSSYSKVLQLGDSVAATVIINEIKQIRSIVQNARWTGYTALTDKAILLAHITRCEQSKRTIYFLSSRDGSEIAKVSSVTFSKGTKRLIENGFLRCVRAAKDGLAPQYSLSPSAQMKELVFCLTTTSSNTPCEVVVKQETQSSREGAVVCLGQTDTYGIFEQSIFGKAAEDIWLVLQGKYLTQRQISNMTGRAKGTVSKVVRKLMQHGIICKMCAEKQKVYSATEGFDFQGLAQKLGSWDIAAQRRKRHCAERESYRSRLEYRKYKSRKDSAD